MKLTADNQKKIRKIFQNKKTLLFLFLLLSISSLVMTYNLYFFNRVFPGVYVSGISVSGHTKTDVENRLSSSVNRPEKITLVVKDKTFDMSLREVGLNYDFAKTAAASLLVYRSGNAVKDQYNRMLSFFNKKNLSIVTSLDKNKLNEFLQVISTQVTKEPIMPVVFLKDGQIVVEKGVPGEELDLSGLSETIEQKLSFRDYSPIQIYYKSIDPTISDLEAEKLKQRAQKFVNRKIVLTDTEINHPLIDSKLLEFLDPQNDYDENKILITIENDISPVFNRNPQNALFRYENERVVEFMPAKDGITVDRDKLKDEIINSLKKIEFESQEMITVNIPIAKKSPSITTEQVNNLGIKELLGRGASRFRGSIPGRIHNVGLAASKFNGILLSPGSEFSFNKTLGDVSVYTGYKQAYIIKDGRTVLGDGGGVCQVSTTLFRALLNAGLPIKERRSHSYRVSYYEQESSPGLDATVYDPTTDLKFKNDTPAHILIQTIFDAKTSSLTFEIYGTSDGRKASITKPVVTSVLPPPEDLYVDDPTLPQGTVKQIDYKAWGAKVVFDYTVERGGETLIEKAFVSNYRPWQAVFLKGTGPIN